MIYEQYINENNEIKIERITDKEVIIREIDPEDCGLKYTGVYAAVEEQTITGTRWAMMWCVKRTTGNLERFGGCGSYETLDDARAYIDRHHGKN